MADILQMTIAKEFSEMKMSELWITFQWHIFLKVQLIISQYCSDNAFHQVGDKV